MGATAPKKVQAPPGQVERGADGQFGALTASQAIKIGGRPLRRERGREPANFGMLDAMQARTPVGLGWR
jgi:hypothetical protein